jgi:hypothetical protein
VIEPPQRAATCDPRNYLDRAPGVRFGDEDNADFVDRSDPVGRARNRDGFIHGPVALADGRIAVNDRVAAIGYRDVMPRIMKRVALEVSACLRYYGALPENAERYPRPVPACGHGELFGTVPDTPFLQAQSASGGRMLERWWRTSARFPETLAELPTREDACRIAVPPWDAGPVRTAAPGSPSDEGETAGDGAPSWWNAWKSWVFYSVAAAHQPSSSPAGPCAAGSCVQLVDADGTPRAGARHFAVIVSPGCPDASVCGGAAGCDRIRVESRNGVLGHALAAYP